MKQMCYEEAVGFWLECWRPGCRDGGADALRAASGAEAAAADRPTAPTAPTGDGPRHRADPEGVKADGKALPAGTYQVRLTAQEAKTDAKGTTESLERWVEFVQGGR